MRRILLIDDEEGIRIVWKRFHDVMEPTFRGQCELDTAVNIEQGMTMLRGKEYDAIILDLNLPPNTSDEIITFIFEHAHSLPPIMVLTGDEDIFIRRRCILAGAAGFFTKVDALALPNLFFKELYNEYLKRYAATREPAKIQ